VVNDLDVCPPVHYASGADATGYAPLVTPTIRGQLWSHPGARPAGGTGVWSRAWEPYNAGLVQ
jgi:hypothetical protein